MRLGRLSAALTLIALVSCGGGGGGGGGPTTTTITLDINWPARTRDVNAPTAALSAVVTIPGAKPGGGDYVWTINRDPGTAAYTKQYTSDPLVVGLYMVSLNFYAQPDGAGALVGTAKNLVSIEPGHSLGTLLVSGTIASVVVLSNQRVPVGTAQDVLFSALDAQGNQIVVTPGSAIVAVVSGADKLQVTPTGQVQGLAAGTATITVSVDGVKSALTTLGVGFGLAASAWPRWHADNQSSGRGSGSGAVGSLKWSFDTGAVNGTATSPVIGADGTVYVGVGLSNPTLYALDGATGAKKWSFAAPRGLYSPPAIGADGTVYFKGGDFDFFAIDGSSGAQKWHIQFTGQQLVAFPSSPAIGADGTVFIATGDNAGDFLALDGTTGATKWAAKIFPHGSPALSPDGSTIYVTAQAGLDALDARTGTVKWQAAGLNGLAVVGPDGTVYVGTTTYDQSSNMTGSTVDALEGSSGSRKWHLDIPLLLGPDGSGLSAVADLAVGADGTLFVAAGKLYAYTPAGAKKWEYAVPSSSFDTPDHLAIASDNTIYCYAQQALVALEGANGAPKWQLPLTAATHTGSPAIGANGTLYAVTDRGSVLAVN